MQTVTQQLPLSQITPRNGFNPRRHFDNAALQELAESLKRQGLIQPIVVRPANGPDEEPRFELIAGERRWRAAQLAGFSDISAIVRDLDERQALAIAAAENDKRKGISAGEEAMLARRMLDAFDGDRQRAAAELNWSETKLSHRLALLNCIEPVLDAVASNSITLGHAELIAGLPQEMQQSVCDKVVAENVSVAQLKEKLNGFSIPLAWAKFDVQGCQACPHNSALQGSLFGEHLDGARCQNRACFGEKTKAFLDARKVALADEYNAVFFDTEKDPSLRTIVLQEGPKGVGREQYHNGCRNCANFGCVIRTSLGKHTGDTEEDVCLDLTCHAKKVSAYQKARTEPSRPQATPAATAKAGPGPANKKPAASIAKLPGPLAEMVNQRLVAGLGALVAENEQAQWAFVAYAVAALSTESASTLLNLRATTERAVILDALADMDLENLKKIVPDLVCTLARSERLSGDYDGSKQCATAATLFKRFGRADHTVFSVSPETLEKMTKGGIESICREAGFAKWYDSQHDKGAFEKLLKGSKKALVAAVTSAKYPGFSQFVPKVVADHIKSFHKSTPSAAK